MTSRLLIAAALTASLAACATSTRPGYGYSTPPPSSSAYYPPAQPQRCDDCGQIVRIESVYGARDNSRAGAVRGGVVGAVAGAVAGNAIENRMIAETYAIHVRMDDGRTLIFNRNSLGAGVREGAYVRVEGTGFDVLR